VRSIIAYAVKIVHASAKEGLEKKKKVVKSSAIENKY
jgi:hypothetical protein